jgi:DNA-directed RNA polymerase specialized sigma24 family protein
VYHAALRQLGNPHNAEEATQAVFIGLAQKAGKIPRNAVLSGWLFRATPAVD